MSLKTENARLKVELSAAEAALVSGHEQDMLNQITAENQQLKAWVKTLETFLREVIGADKNAITNDEADTELSLLADKARSLLHGGKS